MITKERAYKIAEIIAICVFFTLGCYVGRISMENFDNSLTAFNIPALATLLIGDILVRLTVLALKDPERQKRKTVAKTRRVFDAHDEFAGVKAA